MAKIAYCPTMRPYVEKISDEFDKFDFLPSSSAAEVLYLLRTNYVDATLIGREAKKVELDDNVKSFRLMNGNTLIYHQKAGIGYEQLKKIEIYTYLPEESISEIKDAFGKITFLSSLDECLRDGLETPVLISWKDYRDEFELLIPMTATGKAPYFRAPVLYFHDENIFTQEVLEKMKGLLNK